MLVGTTGLTPTSRRTKEGYAGGPMRMSARTSVAQRLLVRTITTFRDSLVMHRGAPPAQLPLDQEVGEAPGLRVPRVVGRLPRSPRAPGNALVTLRDMRPGTKEGER